MKKEKKYIEYILKQAEALLAIDSPSGFTEKVTDYLCEEYKRLGYKPVKTKKGGVLVEIGGKGNAILTMAHVDTLGARYTKAPYSLRMLPSMSTTIIRSPRELLTPWKSCWMKRYLPKRKLRH